MRRPLSPESRAAILATLPDRDPKLATDDQIIELVEHALWWHGEATRQANLKLRKSSKKDIKALARSCSKTAKHIDELGPEKLAFLVTSLRLELVTFGSDLDAELKTIEIKAEELAEAAVLLHRLAKVIEAASPDDIHGDMLIHGNRDPATTSFLWHVAAAWNKATGDFRPPIYKEETLEGGALPLGAALPFFQRVAQELSEPLDDGAIVSFVDNQYNVNKRSEAHLAKVAKLRKLKEHR
jgi:hypothetical protein